MNIDAELLQLPNGWHPPQTLVGLSEYHVHFPPLADEQCVRRGALSLFASLATRAPNLQGAIHASVPLSGSRGEDLSGPRRTNLPAACQPLDSFRQARLTSQVPKKHASQPFEPIAIFRLFRRHHGERVHHVIGMCRLDQHHSSHLFWILVSIQAYVQPTKRMTYQDIRALE